MFNLTLPWWEIVLRAIATYAALFLLFRFIGKKQLGKMSPFDIVLLLIVSESVSNGLTGGDDSLSAGLLCAAALLLVSLVVDRAVFHSKRVETLVEGEPQILVRDGELRSRVLEREKVTKDEVFEALREHGIETLEKVRLAVLETNGQISIIKYEGA